MSDYERALSLAKAGKLQEAQELLLGLDDEKSERLLQKVNAAIAARGKASSGTVAQTSKAVAEGIKLEKQESFKAGCRAVAIVLAVLAVCFIGFFISIQPSAEKSRDAICAYALEGMPNGTRCVLDQFPNEMQVCQDRFLYVYDNNMNIWLDCLLDQGVGSNMLDFPN